MKTVTKKRKPEGQQDGIVSRPILFSSPMVRAILGGSKTMTRRVVNFDKHGFTQPLPHVEYARDGMPIWWSSPPSEKIRASDYYDNGFPCPYGRVGDRLWVRETCRITLEITRIRVERLQQIGIDDVLAEGIEAVTDGQHANQYWREETRDKFVDLWDKLNGPRGFSWKSDPWVWVVEFKRV